jgi:hypothetical protein
LVTLADIVVGRLIVHVGLAEDELAVAVVPGPLGSQAVNLEVRKQFLWELVSVRGVVPAASYMVGML